MLARSHPQRPNRSAAIYLVVLMATLIVATIALSTLETARWVARDRVEEAGNMRVRLAAEAGLELVTTKLNSEPNWRTNHALDTASAAIDFDGISLTYQLSDEDGDLSDDEYDMVEVIVTATQGNHRFAWQATLEPRGDPLPCLGYAIATDKKIEVKDLSAVATDHPIASNDKVKVASDGNLSANCEAPTFEGTIYGTTTTLASTLTIPDKSVLDYYISQATEISINDLPTDSGRRVIENALLSPTTNTLSADLNDQGIYYIDCNNKEIVIRNSRLHCTLVLEKPKNGSKIQESIHWEAAVSNYPILLVGDGEMEFAVKRTPLSESSTGTNFNPPGTPYREVSDSTTDTVYPSQLRGLIYVDKKVELKDGFGENEFVGPLIVDHELKTTGDLFLHYRDIYWYDPPPGFQTASQLFVSAGSVKRVSPP